MTTLLNLLSDYGIYLWNWMPFLQRPERWGMLMALPYILAGTLGLYQLGRLLWVTRLFQKRSSFLARLSARYYAAAWIVVVAAPLLVATVR